MGRTRAEKERAIKREIERIEKKAGALLMQGISPEDEQAKELAQRLAVQEARLKEIRAKKNTEKRKKRTKKLIEAGILALNEAVLWGPGEKLPKVPYAEPVLKSEDPEAFIRYKQYRAFVKERSRRVNEIEIEQFQQWFSFMVRDANRYYRLKRLAEQTPLKDGRNLFSYLLAREKQREQKKQS